LPQAKKAHVALQQLGFDRSAARRLADPRMETGFDTASAVADLRVQAKVGRFLALLCSFSPIFSLRFTD
jgi:hypothetical protein